MSELLFFYGLLHALTCLGAVDPPAPAPASDAATTATATTTTAAASPAPVAAEVPFADGSSGLDSAARQNLEIALREARLKGRITEIQVLSWGDASTGAGQPASDAQVSLAERRGQAVAAYLRATDPAVPVKTVNVTQRPTALQTLLSAPGLGAQPTLGRIGLINPDTVNKRAEAVVLVILR